MNDRRTLFASLLVVAILIASALVTGPPDARGRGAWGIGRRPAAPACAVNPSAAVDAEEEFQPPLRDRLTAFAGSRRFIVLTLIGVVGGLALFFIFRADHVAARAIRESERLAIARRTARGLAHEIRNPLNAMRLAIDLLGRGEPGHAERYLGILKDEIERLDRTVGRFQRLSKEIRADVHPGDLTASAAAACDLLEPLFAERGARLVRSFAAEPLQASHDPALVHEALVNLLKNAAEAVPAGGTVTVTTERTGGRDRVEVRDDGPGLTADVASRLFELYVTTKPEGSGVGLALARALTEAQGGRIVYRSAPGDTRFALEFPEAA